MHKRILFLALFFSVLFSASAEELPAGHAERMKAGTALFQKSIRPVLIETCLKCHGDEKVRSGFDLSSRELLLKGGESGDAIDLEKPENSFLLALIKHEEEPTMPPKKGKLADGLIADFEKWVKLGAPYDQPLLEKKSDKPEEMRVTESDREFWSFKPLASVQPPATEGSRAKTEIDAFVFSKLKEKGLSPNPPASDQARIRRAYLSVIGLPPTPEQLKAAQSMTHAELVDELLESPHYGERWARHWLDAARFGESHGFEQDYDRKYAFHYRDFVIKAFNSDMPWDQFIRYQLAGDEIAPDDPLAMMATGFLGAGVFPTQLTEKEFESARYDELDDMAATTGTAMLGLTIGCARCHDHKFDPIPVKDYYRFVSTFTTTIRSEIDIALDSPEQHEEFRKWEESHAQLVSEKTAHEKQQRESPAFADWIKNDATRMAAQGDWNVLDIGTAKSSESATSLTVQDDGSIFASGNPPAKETYTVIAKNSPRETRFIRIEALTDSSMKQGGPGRAGNGNFALSHFTISATLPDGSEQPLKIIAAKATHQQNTSNLSVASAFDGDLNATGWAVDFGGIGKDQAAVFELEKPVPLPKDARLTFALRFSNNAQHSLGKFRLSASESPGPPTVVGGGINAGLKNALDAISAGKITPEHRETLFPVFAKSDPQWNRINDALRKSLAEKPKPTVAKVQVTSEGFKPTKHHADGRGFPHFYPETFYLNRGDPNQKLGVAESGFLQVLMRNDTTDSHWQKSPPPEWTRTTYRRLGLANWITDTENGAGQLLARVAVNRMWHHHFGRGIVATPNDFGLQGALPSHPELLDFLAQRLIDSGWSLKTLHRDILLSATWQQSSSPSVEKSAIDPDNELIWRFTSRRLEAEVIRDSILAAAGQLDETMFGPGTLSADHRRRSIYFMIKRSRLIPMMQIFDQPEPLASQGSRPSTTIAPQALMFMNNAQVIKWARALANSVDTTDTDAAIDDLYLRTLNRSPGSSELNDSRSFIETQSASYNGNKDARQLAFADLCQILFSLNEFVYLP